MDLLALRLWTSIPVGIFCEALTTAKILGAGHGVRVKYPISSISAWLKNFPSVQIPVTGATQQLHSAFLTLHCQSSGLPEFSRCMVGRRNIN
jgi:hypothetical protein